MKFQEFSELISGYMILKSGSTESRSKEGVHPKDNTRADQTTIYSLLKQQLILFPQQQKITYSCVLHSIMKIRCQQTKIVQRLVNSI